MAKRIAKPKTEMTVADRAASVLKFDATKAELAELAKQSERITEIRDSDSYQECHGARMALKNARIEITKRGKDAREDATAFSKAVIAKEKELVDTIDGEEQRLKALQDGYDNARAAEREAKARADRERLEGEQRALTKIRDLPLQCVGQSADQIQQWLDATRDLDLEDIPERVRDQAIVLRDETMAKLQHMVDEKRSAEAESARLKAEREQLEADKRRQEAERAESERVAREAREEEDRKAQAERKRLDDEARAQREREAAALKEKQDAEQAQRDADAAAERKRQQEAADKLRQEREEFERRRAEAEKAERERAIADATLISAAREALDLLNDSGFSTNLVTLKLAAAVERERLRDPRKEAA